MIKAHASSAPPAGRNETPRYQIAKMRPRPLNGDELVDALKWSLKRFAKMRAELLEAGHTDGEIVKAMSSSRRIVDAVGALSSPPRVKHGRRK